MNMRKGRQSLGLVAAALLAVQTIVMTEASAAPMVPQIPVTTWTASGITGSGVDGVGALMAPVTVPTPGPGQSTENKWAHALIFHFVGASAPFGVISLDTDGTNKFATISINNGAAEAAIETERFPFDWRQDRFYLPVAVTLPGNAVAGFVYDFTNEAWTFVGTARTQPTWGEISPHTSTLLAWYGNVLEDCAAYPRADYFAYAPYAFDAGNAITSTATSDFVTPGDCPAEVNPASDPNFRRYEAGSLTGTTTTTSSTTTTTAPPT